jgi:hypothetical protein
MNPLIYYVKQAQQGDAQRKLWVAQFVDDFRRAKDVSAIEQALIEKDPVAKLFEAIVHQLCEELRLPVPNWLFNFEPLKHPFFVSNLPHSRFLSLRESPYLFRVRNVFVPANYLSRA